MNARSVERHAVCSLVSHDHEAPSHRCIRRRCCRLWGNNDTTAAADDDFQIDEVGSSLVSDSTEDGANEANTACKDGDHEHKGHKKHRFKMLDRLDGKKDHQITLGRRSLSDLSSNLLEKLKALDTNTDGVVTKDEMKARRDHDHNKKGEGKDHEDKGDGDRGAKKPGGKAPSAPSTGGAKDGSGDSADDNDDNDDAEDGNESSDDASDDGADTSDDGDASDDGSASDE